MGTSVHDAMSGDPYEILGVARDSGPHEWKRAYRRLAMRWHPDRNADPHATERFKQIGAAYEQLLAVDEAEEPETEDAATAEPEPEAQTVPRAADIRHSLELDLEEAAAGCRKTLHYTRGKACPTCDGSGEAGIARTRFCDECHGSGRIRDAARVLVPCEACAGRGLFTERICPDCVGSGRENADVSLEIAVPPAMLPGDELRLAGQGEPGGDGLLPGDLYLTVIFHAHPLFEPQGRDLRYAMPVSALSLIAGAEIELPVLAGSIRHALAPGRPERRELRLAGLGYPGRGGSPAGDLVVDLQPVFPAQLGGRLRKLLLQADRALLDDAEAALPEVAGWQQIHLRRGT